MLYAWPIGVTDFSNLKLRIRANSSGQVAFCPTCKAEVVSVRINTVWQWRHVKKCMEAMDRVLASQSKRPARYTTSG